MFLDHSLLIGIFIVGFLAIIASMFDKKDKEFVVMLNNLELKIK